MLCVYFHQNLKNISALFKYLCKSLIVFQFLGSKLYIYSVFLSTCLSYKSRILGICIYLDI